MAIKYCWATNRRGSSLKGVMKLKEIGHDQSPVGVTVLDRQKNTVVCKTEKEPELCDRWIILGRQSPQVSIHINRVEGLETGRQGHLQKDKKKWKINKGLGMQVPVKMGCLFVWIV